jgi:hypothetical protein
MTEGAKELLTKIAHDTSLRYAMHMIMASALVCQKRKGTEVDIQDLKKVGGALAGCFVVVVAVACRVGLLLQPPLTRVVGLNGATQYRCIRCLWT